MATRIHPAHLLRTIPPSSRAQLEREIETVLPRKLVASPAAAASLTAVIELDLPAALLHDDRSIVRRGLAALVDVAMITWATTERRGPISFRFDGREYTGQGGPIHYSCTDAHWVASVLHAFTLRRRDALDAALAFPPEFLNRASNLESDEWRYALFEAFRAVLTREPNVVGREIARAKQLTNPAIATIGGPRYARRALRELEMLEAVVKRDQAAFSAAAWDALEAHRMLFGRGRERAYADCYVAWRVVGLAALAFDRGLVWEIDSAYAPRWLIEGVV